MPCILYYSNVLAPNLEHKLGRIWNTENHGSSQYLLKDTALCYCNILWLRHRIKSFQNNQHLNQSKMFKSSHGLFYDMTIYGLSCHRGRPLKQRILESQSHKDHRDDLTLSHFFQMEKLRPTAIITTGNCIIHYEK